MKAVRIYDEDYEKVKEIAKYKERKYMQIMSYAIDNYYKITIGNRLSKKEA